MKGKNECQKCKKEFEWRRTEKQILERGQPKYCSLSCLAKATQRTKAFRWENLNDEQKIERLRKSFSKKYEKKDNGCWIWISSRGKTGYGNISYNKTHISAHRASWIIYNGKIENDFLVCHKCDNPSCVNPAHLFLGSHKDNSEDRDKKLRGYHGENHHKAKLKDDDIREIRKLFVLGVPCSRIAKQFNVSDGMIWFIKNGRYWKHIN